MHPHRNYIHDEYHEYQPVRKYGPQYEPGGYSSLVQQRSDMTQREDALKFEQGRIKALQEERLHIQKKTFTKWMNSFLQKARMEVDDLFVDLADGRRLLRLLEIISGERLARPNSGRMRVHKIENVNKSLAFLHTKVRLESIGAEDIVDGNPRLILGLIWTIILRFQIQEIEIDVDEENESSEKKSAKDALLLWCQRKTSGYHGVHIHNFTDCWRTGLGFNALIHAHRPDLFRWSDLPKKTNVDTLNHAFDVAHQDLGIPKLLDAEDVDTSRPDEKSVMTYVASYYHTFARMKNEQKSGRRIANIIGQLMTVDSRKAEYVRLLTALLEWIRLKIVELDSRDLPNSLDGIQRLLLAFKQYRTVEKPPKYKERSEIEALYFDINTMQKSLTGEAWTPPDGQMPQEVERAWQRLERAEHAREIALRTELLRQQKLEQLNYKFNTKSVLRKGYLKEMIQVLSDPRYGWNLAQVDATVKKHEAISADILARTERFEDLSAMAAELVKENYHDAEAVTRTEQQVLARWRELLALLAEHRDSLARLASLMALVREADTARATVEEMHTQFMSEEVGPHLAGVERLAQEHSLRELQLGALDETIRRLVRQGAAAQGPEAPKQQLHNKLKQLEDAYDSLLAAAKDRKARLEDARNLYQFLEDHDEEEGWMTDRQRICQTGVAAKDLRGVLALQQKHAALLQELRAREPVTARVFNKGKSLIAAKHPKSGEVERRLVSLERQHELLKDLAAAREKKLVDAAEAYQFYADANEAESWMKERHTVAASSDVGSDAPAASALLARQRTLHEEVAAYRTEIDALEQQSERLHAAGIDSLQMPTEAENGSAGEEEEVVKETRLVPTEVWEEEPVERLEHRTVTEERSVPQVKALYAFSGQGISMQKGEVMFLINKTNPDWWSVRKADRSDGFVPANYVREIEPRVIPVQVRRPEKVRTVQRVKKTVLVKQVVSVKRPATRRTSRAPPPQPADTVRGRMNTIKDAYEQLVSLCEARRQHLVDAIELYEFFAECDDFDKWIREKEKLLRADDAAEGVENAKRKYEKLVTDLSAASKRLEAVDAAADALTASRRGQAARVAQRQRELRHAWDKLVRLRQAKEKSLEGASSMELFTRTCDEAREWMSEKSQQLDTSLAPAADLRTVQALQRRHAQLERELEPLQEKVNTVHLLADSVMAQYNADKPHVETRLKEVREKWQQCKQAAAERRARLEHAVGQEIFHNSSRELIDWVQKVRAAVATEAVAKDVATAEALYKEHQDLKDDIKAHQDEFKEVVGLGQKLVASNPQLKDVAERVDALQVDHDAMIKEWAAKEEHLKQLVQLQTFNREADQVDASSGAHEAALRNQDHGNSVHEAEVLVKRHEELEARLTAQHDRLRALVAAGERLANAPHYAADHIRARVEASKARRAAVRTAAGERRRALQASLAYQQFLAAADDLDAWIQDKLRTANDQNYRDLSNLERKLQKHEAYERELNANEKQLRNVDSVGQSLIASDPVRAPSVKKRLDKLQKAWASLVAASRDKGSKLRQANAQRSHRRSVEDAKARLLDLERALLSDETGADLRSCKRLLNQHTALEAELSSMESRASELAAAGADLVAEGHFDADNIQKDSQQLLNAASALREPSKARRAMLEEGLRLHKLAAEISGELQWIAERQPQAASDSLPSDLHSAQHAHKKHAKLREEIAGHRPHVDKVLQQAHALPGDDKIKTLSAKLSESYEALVSAADARAARLESALKAQQFLHDALEVDAWLADKAAALASTDLGRDRHHAMQLLTRHKALELELDTYAAIVSEMGHAASSMASAGHPDAAALVQRQQALTHSLQRLQRSAAQRQKALVESMCRHEYVVESAELEQWIQEQMAAASSEDYGQDFEHLLVLRSKFDELRHRVETGSERFAQCEELAKKLVASESPYIPDIENRQEALGECWQRLVEQIQSRGARLAAAGDIHRFHRDVADALARMADKRAQLDVQDAPRDYNAALALLRRHETIENDLVALDAQLQVLQEDAERLQRLYPGGNVAQIARQQRALADAWAGLRAAAAERRERLHAAVDLHRFLTQVRDLSSWSSGLRATMTGEPRVRDASSAQALRAEHDAAKSEIEAREDSFRATLELGQAMVQGGHRSAQEVEEKCAALLEERAKLHGAWQARQVALDQLIDLHFFLRDAKQLHSLCAAQEAALSTEISPTSSVEEVDNQLKKHEAFEKLLVTQDEKLSTLNTHGAKLLQQNHVESQRIAEELEQVNKRRKKVHALSSARRDNLHEAALRAQFSRDAAEVRHWIAGKMKKLDAERSQGEVTSLEDKIKKLQKHQAFRAEVQANEERVAEVARTAAQLGSAPGVKDILAKLLEEWKQLLKATEERGRGLEEAQDMLEFNQQLDKIEAWIRDKEMMVGAHELGRDYEHCSALLRKLDDVDSDMRVDDKHIRNICALADKLIDQGKTPSQQSKSVQQRRDAFLEKWRALSGALHSYREHLKAALDIHAFNRDVADTSERMSEKATLLSSAETGRDLAAVRELRRKHDALATEVTAVGGKICDHETAGTKLAKQYPDRKPEIEARLAELSRAWQQLLQLAERRGQILDDAITLHKFNDDLKELEVYVGESVKRSSAADPPTSVADAEALLGLHEEKKTEVDGRQKTIAALQKEAEALAATPEQVQEHVEKLKRLSTLLHESWSEKRTYLTQALELQKLKELARQTEDWLAEKEAFLNNDDLGESLAAVETLIRKHADFATLLESQKGRVAELEKHAARLGTQHRDRAYIERRVRAVKARSDKLEELCAARGARLEQSRALQLFLRDLYAEQEWIALKMQVANDHTYRDLANLQSKIQKHAAFESELRVNKGRVDDVGGHGEELIESKHYASEEIKQHVANLERSWRQLEEAAAARRERLAAAYQARVFLRGLEDLTLWLDDVEAQLLSEDHGTELAGVNALLKRHTRLEAGVAARADTVAHLAETAQQLADQGHFMADEILDKADSVVKRYRSLQEPMSARRDNLEDAQLLHLWTRDADEELAWMKEREPLCRNDDSGATLAHAQSLQKKHLALEAELLSREPIVSGLSVRATELARRGHFAGAQLEARAQHLHDALRGLGDLAAARRAKLRDAIEMHQFKQEASEVEAWLAERRPALVSPDVGRDEESVRALQRRLHAQQRETTVAANTLADLDKLAAALQERPTVNGDKVRERVEGVRKEYEELKLLTAKRQQRLEQSLKYFTFVRECEEAVEWINDQVGVAASEEYGSDVEHVETLQHAFDNFLATVHANEGRIEAVAESGAALLEEGTPEGERVKRKVEDVRGLWEDLKELALARQEALAGARQVHVFDRTADETVGWIAEKESALGSEPGFGHHDLHTIQALARKHEALGADLEAVKKQVEQLTAEAERLGAAFPDAKEHVTAKLEDVTESFSALQQRARDSRDQLRRAEQLQTYFDSCQELMAWTSEALARVTAPELAHDVSGAEQLVARHDDIKAEIKARDAAFANFYTTGEKLVTEGHFLSSEISERMAALRARRALLDETWRRRAELYAQHLDALIFKRDADALDGWITARQSQLRDGKLGESVPHVEELIRKHDDFEKTIESQADKFNALRRITLTEKAFREQQAAEAEARREGAERAERERLEQARRREMQRIADERRREDQRHAPQQEQLASSADTTSTVDDARETPAPLESQPSFDKLTNVKRAESMNVGMKTPKRTPSFTTRRRTQSFRRHRENAELPPVEIKGYLERKQEAGCGGKRATVRSWRQYYSVLCGQLLCFFRDELDLEHAKAAAPPVAILNAKCEPAGDYTKRKHVFRLACADGAEFLFASASRELMLEWVKKIAFHAALPPQLQLTPYQPDLNPQAPESPTAELRRKLHRSDSMSSSGEESPEPARRHRTQTEILREHREQQMRDRNIESSVLPSLPPRQLEDPADTMLRKSDAPTSQWGSTRFSNGRDPNTEFIRSQQQETAPPLPPTGPPEAAGLLERAHGHRQPHGQVSAMVSSYQRNLHNSRTTPTDGRNNNREQPAVDVQGNWMEGSSHKSFHTASEFAYAKQPSASPPSRPSSVASALPEQRHLSESSGESELSVASVTTREKKKGVFGGLFSRKKRPQSHM